MENTNDLNLEILAILATYRRIFPKSTPPLVVHKGLFWFKLELALVYF